MSLSVVFTSVNQQVGRIGAQVGKRRHKKFSPGVVQYMCIYIHSARSTESCEVSFDKWWSTGVINGRISHGETKKNRDAKAKSEEQRDGWTEKGEGLVNEAGHYEVSPP